MNHFVALQRLDGRWDYSCNRHPWGYCAAFREPKEGFWTPKAIAEHTATKDKHHTGGHATKEEAEACYKEYLLDHQLQLDREDKDQQMKCKVCGEWTTKFAMLGGYTLWHLCDRHRNREEVSKLYNIEESWQS
jgi:hypothetical protein